MKIVDKEKFIKRIISLIILAIIIILFTTNMSFSFLEKQYTNICVSYGDTLWSIAKEEQQTNKQYENMDVRDIVSSIKQLNNLKTSDITEGQILKIETTSY